MSSWVKKIEPEDVKQGKFYFVARFINSSLGSYQLVSRDINGKVCWSSKPGIGVQFDKGGLDNFRQGNPTVEFKIIEVPADSDTRWKARRKVFGRKR